MIFVISELRRTVDNLTVAAAEHHSAAILDPIYPISYYFCPKQCKYVPDAPFDHENVRYIGRSKESLVPT